MSDKERLNALAKLLNAVIDHEENIGEDEWYDAASLKMPKQDAELVAALDPCTVHWLIAMANNGISTLSEQASKPEVVALLCESKDGPWATTDTSGDTQAVYRRNGVKVTPLCRCDALPAKALTFDEWWNKNESQFTADSCHMSEYHMASVVWNAAMAELKGGA